MASDAKSMKQWRVAAFAPIGESLKTDNFSFVTEPLRDLKDGEILVKVNYVSCDPTHRIWMTGEETYMPPLVVGQVMRSLGTGKVVASKNPKFKEGDVVSGALGVQSHAILVPEQSFVNVVPLHEMKGAVETDLIDFLGISGLTAYFGVDDVCKPKQGDVAVVSGAAGAVGVIAGQLLKHRGCKVVGIAGSPEKCKWLTEHGFDSAINYKDHPTLEGLQKAIADKCPTGVDIFFDNVGGLVLDAVLPNLRLKARVAFCGAISSYNQDYGGPKNYRYFLFKRATWQGFLMSDYVPQFGTAIAELFALRAQGVLTNKPQHVEKGLANYPAVFVKLFDGSNQGKLCIDVRDD